MFLERLSANDLKGAITALVTPFKGSRINLDKYGELVSMAKAAGLSGVVPLGTTGETPALTSDEHRALTRQAVEAAGDRMAVIVGAGSNNTSTTVENARAAADLGADAVLVVAPYYNKPTPAGLKKHFTTVADSSPLPIIMYHIPGRCGVGIPLNLVLDLSRHQNIIGIKEAGGDIWRSGEIARQAGSNIAVLSGDDMLTLPLMSVGAAGAISVISNIAPKLTRQMIDLALRGEYAEALGIHRRLSPLLQVLSIETNPGPIKEAMNLRGMEVGKVRPPLASVISRNRSAIRRILEEIGDLE